ncbi:MULTISPECIES: RagB/SusD family nutrient uptake outer membrane protein [unclassified Spirosoma]|uniref:RagB/SusD family nutrient uptake outer membrane protein n=1 Tax=unclassified Spirosoma TaxID=2621999 RepID=UPI0009606124|nr:MULTISPECIES: RagB/SusD family nutrient uptake outer membrane protein [unclassified Spirosoma]MBN8821628.1 RagB/SusD family nutrient uptake outer membrane protein [Spirosoma sp.]OJW78393.1 MAG: RagB/SusD family nutrient uptake outer membrane protein [Spirosoma sp. 48-14]
MKSLVNKRFTSFALALMCTVLAGCKEDFLDEKPVTTLTTDVYYATEAGFEDLVRACYPLLRNIHQARTLVLNGTDIFSQSGFSDPKFATLSTSPLEHYDVRLNASLADLQTLWTLLYAEIARTNTVLSRADGITTMAQATKDARIGEAKFLRALCYFYLVQQWGDVPMPLTEQTTASKEAKRVASADIYKQILSDLLDAETKLPVTASNYGRATKGAAQFLLARVYLTRGWNFKNALGGTAADFDLALQYADKIIDAYPLAATYSALFPQHSENPLKQYTGAQNDKNAEIVFAVQYNTDVLTNKTDPSFTQDAAGGSNLHSVFGGSGEGYPGTKGRTSDYNRHQPFHVTNPAAYRFFDPDNDSRYDWNFVEVGYALQAVAGFKPLPTTNANLKVDIKAGDTVVYFRPWNKPALTLAERGVDYGGKKNYSVVNLEEYGGGYGFINGSAVNVSGFPGDYPMMWKFWQPGIPYGDAYGTLNEIVFRSAEAYLIAAEAIVKGAKNGKLGTADVYYNKVLDRALTKKGIDPQCAKSPENLKSLETVSYRATPANISIDLILDERARELMGEYNRWFDLKRTGKLIERVKKYNPWAAKSASITDKHYLRPIPQGEIDLSYPPMTQNEGY